MTVTSVTILDRCVSRKPLGKPYTEFRIRVNCGEQSSVINRRYTEFEALDAVLRPNMPLLPKLPPKGIVKRMSSALTDQTGFLDQREFQLGQLLSAMVLQDPELHNPALRNFLEVSSDLIPDAVVGAYDSPKVLRPKWLPNHEIGVMDKEIERPVWLENLKLDPLVLTPGAQETASPEVTGAEDMSGDDSLTGHPNFAGMWNLEQVEGDMEALMTELELPWIIRKAAARMGYGVNKSKVNVSQSDDQIEVENINPIKSLKRVYCVDGVEHDEVLDGRRLKTSSHWEGSILVSESRNAKTGKAFPKVARYLQDNRMIAEQFLQNGQIVKQIFVKGPQMSRLVEQDSAPMASDAPDAASDAVNCGPRTESDDQASVTTSETEVSRPDFGGRWLLARNEGDMEALLKEVGLPWVARKAASAMKYGVGQVKSSIMQSQDVITIETVTPMKTFSKTIAVDGVEHDMVDDGKSFRTLSRWESNVLVTESRLVKPAKTFPIARRYLDGEEMIVENKLVDGKLVKQVFVRA